MKRWTTAIDTKPWHNKDYSVTEECHALKHALATKNMAQQKNISYSKQQILDKCLGHHATRNACHKTHSIYKDITLCIYQKDMTVIISWNVIKGAQLCYKLNIQQNYIQIQAFLALHQFQTLEA